MFLIKFITNYNKSFGHFKSSVYSNNVVHIDHMQSIFKTGNTKKKKKDWFQFHRSIFTFDEENFPCFIFSQWLKIASWLWLTEWIKRRRNSLMKLSVMSQIHSFRKTQWFLWASFFSRLFFQKIWTKKINIWNYMQVTYQSITY